MGIISSLFGTNPPIQQPPQLQSIFPLVAEQKIRSGLLPTIQADKIILNKGEICHFVDVAATVTQKRIYQNHSVGGSYHVWKGFTMRTGDSTSVPEEIPEYTKGILFFTNKRIVFVADKHGFDKKISALTAKSPYSDAIALQFGNKSHVLLLPNVEVAKLALDLII